MKYIKKFNEVITYNGFDENFQEELKDFCEMGLTYLLDDDAQIRIDYRDSLNIDYSNVPADADLYLVKIILDEEPKLWSEIKDYMIPFLIRLNNKYEVNNTSYNRYNKMADIKLNLLISNHVSEPTPRNGFIGKYYYKMADLIKDQPKYKGDIQSSLIDKCKITKMYFLVTGYKQPKKSILTKLKSFFK
jgi:hypothetical protein